jgi:hypothetical protein
MRLAQLLMTQHTSSMKLMQLAQQQFGRQLLLHAPVDQLLLGQQARLKRQHCSSSRSLKPASGPRPPWQLAVPWQQQQLAALLQWRLPGLLQQQLHAPASRAARLLPLLLVLRRLQLLAGEGAAAVHQLPGKQQLQQQMRMMK